MPRVSYTYLLILVVFYSHQTNASASSITTRIETSKFQEGLNLTDGQAAISLAADWSSSNGSYVGANCYSSLNGSLIGLSHGCDLQLGFFLELPAAKKSDRQAISVEINRLVYERFAESNWDYSQATLNWHINKAAVLSLKGTENWLGRGVSTRSIAFSYQRPIYKGLVATSDFGVTYFEQSAPVNSMSYAQLGIQYHQQRWSLAANVIFSDENLQRMTGFMVNKPDALISLSYRLY